MGGLIALLAATMVALALNHGGAWLWLLWPALSFAIVAVGYLLRRPEVFGKRPDGGLRLATVPFLLPYLVYAWLTWFAMRLVSRESVSCELLPGLHIGRRVFASELPPGTASVIDLTSEFPEPRGVRAGREYLASPLLDRMGTTTERLADTVARMRRLPTPLYLHCAQGHGRTAMVAVAFLLATGHAKTVDVALAMIWRVRPHARPSAAQRRALMDYASGS